MLKSLFNKVAGLNCLKKNSDTEFSYAFFKVLKNTSFYRTPAVAASICLRLNHTHNKRKHSPETRAVFN